MVWVFLVVTLGAPFDGYVSVIPQRGQKQCEDNMIIAEVLFEGLPVEMVQCIPTSIAIEE